MGRHVLQWVFGRTEKERRRDLTCSLALGERLLAHKKHGCAGRDIRETNLCGAGGAGHLRFQRAQQRGSHIARDQKVEVVAQ